jgi:predicted short-subunit dehydrogenase-like oxidoreductase (DUF2520 family)
MVHPSPAQGKLPLAIIGAGRVGSTLAVALYAMGYPITAVWSRTPAHAADLAARVGAIVPALESVAEGASLTLIAVSDDSLAELSARLASSGVWRVGHMVAHCSGVLPAAVLAPVAEQGALIGGFHPLAAISEREQILPRGITFAVEAAEPLRGILWQMARDIHGYPFDLDPAGRSLYHAAAVIASNYTVVLAALAADLLEHAGVETDETLRAILPLLHSTLSNLERAGLPDALTGPLVRGDAGTVSRHLAALDATNSRVADVYRALGAATLPLAAARGGLDLATLDLLKNVLATAPHMEDRCESPFAISSV